MSVEDPRLVVAPAGRRWLTARNAATAAFLVAVLVVGGVVIADRREQVLAALATIGVLPALLCLLLTGLGVTATGECWRVWLASLSTPPPWHVAHRLFYVTQAGKYVPGAVWPYAAQAALANRYGVSRTAVLGASALFMLTHLVTGVVVGVVGLGGMRSLAPRMGLLYAVAAVGLVLLLPPVLGRLLQMLGRWRTWLRVGTPTWRTTGRAVLLMAAAWACYGLSVWVLVVQLGGGLRELGLVVGVYAIGWVAGFAAVAAPVGIGAREAVVTLLLAPVLGTAAVLSVVVVSRVALTVADLGLAAVSSGVLRSESRSAPGPAAPDGDGSPQARPRNGTRR